MDNAQYSVLIIIGLCIGFVLILRSMFKWNSTLTKQVAALTAERDELQQVIQDQLISASQTRQIITKMANTKQNITG